MCELCSKREIWEEPLEPGPGDLEAGDLQCEWIPNDDEDDDDYDETDEEALDQDEDFDDGGLEGASPFTCEEPPRWVLFDRSVMEHLCAEHVEEEKREREGGLEVFMEGLGMDDDPEFVPITSQEPCDGFVQSATGMGVCSKPAKYAKISTYQFLLCDQHARQWKEQAKGS